MVDIYLHSTIRFHGVLLNQLITNYFTFTLCTLILVDLQRDCRVDPTSYPVDTEGKAARAVKVTTHLQLVPR
jgi:hypothetical protein